MPRYTVVGTLHDEDTVWTPGRVYRGHRPQRIPVGGWGHICSARDRDAARCRAVAVFEEYAAGRLRYRHEIIRARERGARSWWRPWTWGKRHEREDVGEIFTF